MMVSLCLPWFLFRSAIFLLRLSLSAPAEWWTRVLAQAKNKASELAGTAQDKAHGAAGTAQVCACTENGVVCSCAVCCLNCANICLCVLLGVCVSL